MVSPPLSAPDGGSLIPLPPRLLGLFTIVLGLVTLVSYVLLVSYVGLATSTAVLQLGFFVLAVGAGLVLWDELTDFFDESQP
ncbi:hypothetical protein [Haloarchaeobius sp. DFWS5]|uniref:hypothetical protein n=1 Tax=Haloarchaeobius sp. DFWS5 TaxID=3446114 RepID=UPI003EBC91E3